MAERHALEHFRRLQPHGGQRVLGALHAGRDELGRAAVHPGGARLPGLDLLGLPQAPGRPGRDAACRGPGNPGARRRTVVKPLDPRLLRHSAAARGYLAVTVVLGLAAAALILLQAGLLAHLLAVAAAGTGTAVLAGSLAALGAVLLARAAAGYGGGGTGLP